MQCCLFICVQYIYTDGGQPDTVVDTAILKILFIYLFTILSFTDGG